eukprot:763015-Hanusia_phi.AAC.1
MARERCVPACRASHSQSGKQISSKAFPGWSPHAFEASTTASMTKTAPRENIQTALGENIRAFSSSSGGSSDNDKPPGFTQKGKLSRRVHVPWAQAYEKLLDVYAEGFDEDDIQEVLDFFPSSDLKRQAMQSERIKELWLKHGVKFGIESQRLDEIWETIGISALPGEHAYPGWLDESGFTVVVDGSTSPPVAYTVGLSGGDSESLIGARSIIRQCVNELEEKFGLIDVPDDLRLDRRIGNERMQSGLACELSCCMDTDGRKVALKEAKDSKYVNEKYARLAGAASLGRSGAL